MERKGILLAGGFGTRLHPVTLGTNKHLLPVYDKPMVYYPLSVLMLAGLQDILLISNPQDVDQYQRLLGDGERFGISLTYATQSRPDGIAEALILGQHFLKTNPVALILGDNFFYGQGLSPKLRSAAATVSGATLFGYEVRDPRAFGVIEFGADGRAISIEEKPSLPKSNFAVTGLYFYDGDVVEIAKSIQPSPRNELEITCVNRHYLNEHRLNVELLGRGYTWMDIGTHDSILEASMFVRTVQQHQGFKIACLEEIALNQGWLSSKEIIPNLEYAANSDYSRYLQMLLERTEASQF